MTTASGGTPVAGSPSNRSLDFFGSEQETHLEPGLPPTTTENAQAANHPRTELSHQYHQIKTKLDAIEVRTAGIKRDLHSYEIDSDALESFHHFCEQSGVARAYTVYPQNADQLRFFYILMDSSETTRRIGTSAILGSQECFRELGELEKAVDSLVKKFKGVAFEPALSAEQAEHLRELEDTLNLARIRKSDILSLVRSYW